MADWAPWRHFPSLVGIEPPVCRLSARGVN
jgi:hypothetical protein